MIMNIYTVYRIKNIFQLESTNVFFFEFFVIRNLLSFLLLTDKIFTSF